jgi:hypothetical protein
MDFGSPLRAGLSELVRVVTCGVSPRVGDVGIAALGAGVRGARSERYGVDATL